MPALPTTKPTPLSDAKGGMLRDKKSKDIPSGYREKKGVEIKGGEGDLVVYFYGLGFIQPRMLVAFYKTTPTRFRSFSSSFFRMNVFVGGGRRGVGRMPHTHEERRSVSEEGLTFACFV